jgi:hypothetical protein
VQRLYRILLLICIAAGAAVGLWLDEADELMPRAFADPPQPQRMPAPPSTPYGTAQPWMPPTSSAYPSTDASPWSSMAAPAQPAEAVGEAEASDIPANPNRYSMPFEARVANIPKAQEAPAPVEAVPCEGAQILARVGPRVILASEILPPINERLAQYKDKIPPSQVEGVRKQLMRQALENRVEIQRVFCDAERKIPAENLTKIKERVAEQFELMEVPRRIKDAKLDSRRELEEKMVALGTSLEREKRAYIERYICIQWLDQESATSKEVSHEELRAYYQEHLADFEHPARARWEQLMVRKSSRQSNAETRATLARMGNQVIQGASFAEVAKKESQGPTASRGGVQDWTTKGSLVSEPLDQALFGLPVGQLSQIIEDSQGFHIIRVIEREDASRTPFEQAQSDIRKKIGERREVEARKKYLAKIREEIPVWTIFDNEPARPAPATSSTSPFLQR